MSLRDSYKKPDLGSDGLVFKKPFPIEAGRTSFRLVPPMGELYPDGKWYLTHSYHFGYQILDREGKPVARTFTCPKVVDFRSKEVITPCAECENIENKQLELEDLEKQLDKEGASPEEIAERTLELRAWLESHNRTTKVIIHVMNKAGEFGYMQLPIGAFRNNKNPNNLQQVIRNLDEQGVDAFHPETGVWFYIEKQGKGKFGTTYNVGVEQENMLVHGKRQQTDKSAPLSEEQMQQALKDCPKFDTLTNVLSAKIIDQLVKSDGTPESVTAILGLPVRKSEVQATKATMKASVVEFKQPEVEELDEEELAFKQRMERRHAPQTTPGISRSEKFRKEFNDETL